MVPFDDTFRMLEVGIQEGVLAQAVVRLREVNRKQQLCTQGSSAVD